MYEGERKPIDMSIKEPLPRKTRICNFVISVKISLSRGYNVLCIETLDASTDAYITVSLINVEKAASISR
jgi:hypothetical protein